MPRPKILIGICHGEQSNFALFISLTTANIEIKKELSRGLLSSKIGCSLVYARLSYVSFQASESGHFVGVLTQCVVEDRFLSSYSFIFAA